jgi:hypothetical protein
MNLNHVYIKDGQLCNDVISIETAIDRIWWSRFEGLHRLINWKRSAAFYDLYGAEVVRQIYNKVGYLPGNGKKISQDERKREK